MPAELLAARWHLDAIFFEMLAIINLVTRNAVLGNSEFHDLFE